MPSKMLTPHQMFGFLFENNFPFSVNYYHIKNIEIRQEQRSVGGCISETFAQQYSVLTMHQAASTQEVICLSGITFEADNWSVTIPASGCLGNPLFTTLLYINHHSTAFLLVVFVCCTTVNHFLCGHSLSVTTSSSFGMLVLNLHIYLQGN